MSIILKLNASKNRFKNIPKEIQPEVVRKISPQWKRNGQKDLTRGLTTEQEVLIMPNLIGVQPNDPNWTFKVRDFWADYSLVVTENGVELDISTKKVKYKDSNGNEKEIDFPNNIEDYMAYQICLQSGLVAKSESDMNNLDSFSYIMIDKAVEQEKIKSEFEYLSKADIAFSKLISKFTENESTIDWILELLKEKSDPTIFTMSGTDKQMLLRTKKEKDAKKFLKIVADPELENKALIAILLTNSIITKEGNDYYFIDDKIGSEVAMINYLKDPLKSTSVGKMKSQLQTKQKEIKN